MSIVDEVSKQKKTVKREMQAKNNGELQGQFLSVTHADRNTDPPEQQADTTTIRPREVVGPPIQVMERPTLTPRDQTLNYTENGLPT